MAKYRCLSTDKKGEVVSLILDVKDRQEAVKVIDEKGLNLISLKPLKEIPLLRKKVFSPFLRVSHKEIITFSRKLATLLRSGLPLTESLITISNTTNNHYFKELIDNIVAQIQEGNSLSFCLSQYPQVFSNLYVNMTKVAEAGGKLDEVFERLATVSTEEMQTRSRIMSAVLYPVVLLVISFLVVNFLILTVLPKFVVFFKSVNIDLPLPTKLLLGISDVIGNFWWIIIIAFLLFLYLFKEYISQEDARYKFHLFLLKIPIFGELYLKIQICRFSRILALLISSGITVLECLKIVEEIISLEPLKKGIKDARQFIIKGYSFTDALSNAGSFSPLILGMFSSGEASGEMEKILREIVSLYEPEIENTIKNLTTILEPVMLLLMGVLVGFIALSVLLPIFNLVRTLR